MGRCKKQIPADELIELRSQGKSIKEISKDFGISTATLSRRIAELECNSGIITRYRALQNLELTTLQARILENISPEKIDNCSLVELLRSFSILKKAELALQTKGTERITGLVGYLLELEKRDGSGRQCLGDQERMPKSLGI